MSEAQTSLLRDFLKNTDMPSGLDRVKYYRHIRDLIPYLSETYVKRALNILDIQSSEDEQRVKDEIEKLGSGIEPLILVDENDEPLKNSEGGWMAEFRQDYKSKQVVIPESKETPLFCRIVLFILEDEAGNIIVSRRGKEGDKHYGELEMAGGHVIAGYSYLETVYKEIEEELQYKIQDGAVTEEDRLMKYRNFTPPKDNETKGKGNFVAIYRVKVPNVSVFEKDGSEISELIPLSKTELLDAIATGSRDGKPYIFAPHHAYWYLEYLQQQGIDTTDAMNVLKEKGVMNNRTPMELRNENE